MDFAQLSVVGFEVDSRYSCAKLASAEQSSQRLEAILLTQNSACPVFPQSDGMTPRSMVLDWEKGKTSEF